MDSFLLSKCEMFFGGSSGIGLLPASFRRPYFLINNCPLEGVFSIKRIYPTIIKRIKAILNGEGKLDHALRISVVGGGCSGMSYNLSFDDKKGEFD